MYVTEQYKCVLGVIIALSCNIFLILLKTTLKVLQIAIIQNQVRWSISISLSLYTY